MNTYDVSITRTAWGHQTFEVEAESEVEARGIALEAACNSCYTESESEYDVNHVELLSPPEPPMHETILEHRFKLGDKVFVKAGGNVSQQTINMITVIFFSGNLNLEYGYFRDEQCKVYHNQVFATAEEAFQ